MEQAVSRSAARSVGGGGTGIRVGAFTPDTAPRVVIDAMRGDAAAIRSGLSSLGWRIDDAPVAGPLPRVPPDPHADPTPDLCVVSVRGVDGAAAGRLGRLRTGALANPFAAVLLATRTGTADDAAAAARAGVDALVRADDGVIGLKRRAERLAAMDDRDFVVTRDYVGPCRRGSALAADPAADRAAARVRAPNTLRMRVEGRPAEEIRECVGRALARLGDLRAQACMFAHAFSVQAAADGIASGDAGAAAELREAARWLDEAMLALPSGPARRQAEPAARMAGSLLAAAETDVRRMIRDLPRLRGVSVDLLAIVRGDGDRPRAQADVVLAYGRRRAARH